MTPLRQRLIEKLRLKNYSPKTQQAYVAAVAHFARHFGRSPDQLGPEEIHRWQLHLKDVKKASWSGYNIAMSALRFFYREVLEREDLIMRFGAFASPRHTVTELTSGSIKSCSHCAWVPSSKAT